MILSFALFFYVGEGGGPSCLICSQEKRGGEVCRRRNCLCFYVVFIGSIIFERKRLIFSPALFAIVESTNRTSGADCLEPLGGHSDSRTI